jgi:hypothetical protein
MSQELQREDRYIVIKRSDLRKVPVPYRSHLVDPMFSLLGHLPRRECVVVESDWPEYQLVRAMIEHRMAGKPVPDFNLWRQADALAQQLATSESRLHDVAKLCATVEQQLAASQAREADLSKDLKVIDGEHGCACRELAEAQATITRLETTHVMRLQEILDEVSAMEKRQAALQGLLNERDQRLDDAMGLLRETASIVRARCSWRHPTEVDRHLNAIDAFLSQPEATPHDH